MTGPGSFSRSERRDVAQALLAWWEKNRRDFPWRHWGDPYRLLISEILLRQTRAETVAAFVPGFLQVYPGPEELSAASEEELAAALRPLGFYRQRARQLHDLGLAISRVGLAGMTRGHLADLPGVGRYSSAMVIAADGGRVAAVDTNVARVLSRVFGVVPSHAEARKSVNVWAEAEALVAEARGAPIHVTWALLDLGSSVCRERRPRCSDCALLVLCAYAQRELG